MDVDVDVDYYTEAAVVDSLNAIADSFGVEPLLEDDLSSAIERRLF